LKSSKDNTEDVIALVELGGSHDECLYSQIYALRSTGRKVLLVCSQEIRDRNQHFENEIHDYFIVKNPGSGFKSISETRKILSFLKGHNVNRIVINTAQGGHVRNLCVIALFNKIEFVGIIHTTRKFVGSFTQKLINWKIKKYLVLSQHLLSKITPPNGVKVDYFYPIRFLNQSYEKQNNDQLEITVIGEVSNARKDLVGFSKMVKGMVNVQFTFLGKCVDNSEMKSFKKELNESGLSDVVKLYDHFVSQDEFVAQIQKSDAILPLVHPETTSANEYFRNQISGAMSVAFGYNIPLLIHEGYQHVEEMQKASLYYTIENFATISQKLDALRQVSRDMAMNEEYSEDYQEERYLNFVLDQEK
jgi:glycosyltransferase involved in cell wall biosynthesis